MKVKSFSVASAYASNDEQPKLISSVVCYADVLGYVAESSAALKAGEGDEYLRRLRRTLNGAYQRLREKAGAEYLERRLFDVKVFTDNIVVGYPMRDRLNQGEPELADIFRVFTELQASLAMEGVFIRGGIAVGEHYMDEDIVFGDALLEAVNKDRSGGPPRLVLAPSAVKLLRHHLSFYGDGKFAPQNQDVLEDADGTVFLHYLKAAFEAVPEDGVFFDVIDGHRNAIVANLARFKGVPGIRSKYEWAARYHNFVCTEFSRQHEGVSFYDENGEYASVESDAVRVGESVIAEDRFVVEPRRLTLSPL